MRQDLLCSAVCDSRGVNSVASFIFLSLPQALM